MQTLDSYLSSLQDWCEEALLRGLDQLSLDELEALEQRAGKAEAWQLAYLAELLRQTAQAGRAARLGGRLSGSSVPNVPNVPNAPGVPSDQYDGESALADAFCMLSQYVLLAREQGEARSDDSEPEEAGATE